MKAYLQLTWTQLLLFARNKNTIIWSLFLPVFMMIALGTLVGNGGNQVSLKIAVADEDHTTLSKHFIDQFQQMKGVKTTALSREQANRLVKSGDVDLAIVVKKGFAEQLQKPADRVESHFLTIYLDQSNPTVSQLGTTLVEQSVDKLNKEQQNFKPLIQAEVVNVQSKQLAYIDFLVPGILSLLIMSNNLNGVAATIASWRERGILRRMQGTPLKSSTFIAGQMTARILLNSFQAIAVLLIAFFIFDVKVYGSWLTLLFFILLGTLTFMSIGFIVASLAKTPESAAPIAGLISFPMIFVGGIFFPIRDLPGILQPLVKAIPIGYLTDALRGVMNEGLSLANLTIPATVLLVWAAVSFTIASITFRWDVR